MNQIFTETKEDILLNLLTKKYDELNINTNIQDNESKSTKGVLRGLHFQKPPYDQSKLVDASRKVLDVAVDIRTESKPMDSTSLILSEKNKKQFYIPKGFAHGLVA